jgi:hypothetical protein
MQSKGQDVFAEDNILLSVDKRLQSWKKNNVFAKLRDLDPTLWK